MLRSKIENLMQKSIGYMKELEKKVGTIRNYDYVIAHNKMRKISKALYVTKRSTYYCSFSSKRTET